MQSDTSYLQRLQVSLGEISEKFLTSVAGGAPPDLVTNIAYPEFWARGVVQDVSELVEASEVIDKDDIFEASWDAATRDGKVYGVPTIESYLRFGLVYNEDLVSDAGLDPDSPPQTWDEAFEWHKALTRFDEAGSLEILGFDPMDAMGGSGPGPSDPLFWPQSFGFKWWLADELQFNFDDAKFVEALNTIKRFYDFAGVENMAGYRSSYKTWSSSPTASFPAGVQGMIIEGYWTCGWLTHSAPDKKMRFAWSPTSSDRKGVKFQSTGGHYLNIPQGANLEEAFKFAEFSTTHEAADIIFEATGFLGASLSYLEKVDTSKTPGLDWFIASATEADEMNACAACPLSGFVTEQWRNTVDAVNFGDKTPEQAAQDLQKICTEELEKQFPDLT
jgi:ABC-type glycerol-3-phosphate transport system substrate-binding protein